MAAKFEVMILKAEMPEGGGTFPIAAKCVNVGDTTAVDVVVLITTSGDIELAKGFPSSFEIHEVAPGGDIGQQFATTLRGSEGVVTITCQGIDVQSGNRVVGSDSVVFKPLPQSEEEIIAELLNELVDATTQGDEERVIVNLEIEIIKEQG